MQKWIIAPLLCMALLGCGKDQATQANIVSCVDNTEDQPTTFESVRSLALKGNYQAQKNLAFGYVGGFPYKGQDVNQTLGCAWYKVILLSGSEKVNQGDVSNAKLYCGRLSVEEQQVAENQARNLLSKLCK